MRKHGSSFEANTAIFWIGVIVATIVLVNHYMPEIIDAILSVR